MISFEGVLKEKSKESARLDVEGLVIADVDFSGLKEIRANVETASPPPPN